MRKIIITILIITSVMFSACSNMLMEEFIITDPENMITITFDANGGDGYMYPQMVQMDDLYSETEVVRLINLRANNFARNSYTFEGWSHDPDDTSPMYEDEEDVIFTRDRTLYAVWKSEYTYDYMY